MVNDHPEAGLWALAERCGGVFTYRDARRAGMTPKQIRTRCANGSWVPILSRVFRFAATPETELLQWHAALRFCGPKALFARRSAAELWNLDRVRASRPELVVPYESHPRDPQLVVMRSKVLNETDRARRGGFPVTSIERTIIDLAAVANDEELENAVESARRQGLTSVARVTRRLACLDGPGRGGAGRLRQLLSRLDAGTPLESPLEVKVAHLLREAGITGWIAQFAIDTGNGQYRADFAWPQARLVLECDGRAYHTDFEADRARWSAIASAGWRIVFVTWREATRESHHVLARVRAALDGSLTRS